MSEARETGTIKCFFDDKGYGFIVPKGASQQLFFHVTDVIGGAMPSERQTVSFRREETEKGERAFEVAVETRDGKCPLCGAEKAR